MNRKRLHILVGIMMRWIIFIFCRPLKPADISTLEIKWVLALIQCLIPFGVSEHFIRKPAYFTEFLILGALAGVLFGWQCRRLWAGLMFAAMVGIITALCDERIRLFVSGRTGLIPDVQIDVAGAPVGAALPLATQAVIRRKSRTLIKRVQKLHLCIISPANRSLLYWDCGWLFALQSLGKARSV